MSEIPEDIVNAARSAAATSYPDAADVILSGDGDSLYMISTIAAAILAERERCAEVARSVLIETFATPQGFMAVKFARNTIVEAIMKGAAA